MYTSASFSFLHPLSDQSRRARKGLRLALCFLPDIYALHKSNKSVSSFALQSAAELERNKRNAWSAHIITGGNSSA